MTSLPARLSAPNLAAWLNSPNHTRPSPKGHSPRGPRVLCLGRVCWLASNGRFVGRRSLVFKPAKAQHGHPPPWDDDNDSPSGHQDSCVIRGRIRLGVAFDPRLHYDCPLPRRDQPTRRLPSCHGYCTLDSGRRHANIAPNDNVRETRRRPRATARCGRTRRATGAGSPASHAAGERARTRSAGSNQWPDRSRRRRGRSAGLQARLFPRQRPLNPAILYRRHR